LELAVLRSVDLITFNDAANGETLQLLPDDSTTSDSQNIGLVGTDDTAEIDNPASYTGTISNFVPGDTIDLSSIGTATGATLGANNVLSLQESNGGSLTLHLDPSHSYAGDTFVPASDNNGGTDIIITPAQINIETPTSSIVSQITNATYTYTGNEIYQADYPYLSNPGGPKGIVTATATFRLPPGYTGIAEATSFSQTALGFTLTGAGTSEAEYDGVFVFSNGKIENWNLSGASFLSNPGGANNVGPDQIWTSYGGNVPGEIGGPPVDGAMYGTPGAPGSGILYTTTIDASNQYNPDPGTWTLASYDTTVTISPLAGQTQQLSAVLTNPSLTVQGAIQNITVNGPGIIGVTGSATVPAVGGPGTFTDNGTINLGALGTNVLNLDNVTLAGSGFIQQQGESDTTYVSSVSGVDFQVTAGTLELANPTGFNGTIGPASDGLAIGIFGEVDIFNALSVAKASFDTTTGMLSLLNSAGGDVGNIHFAGTATGLRLNSETFGGAHLAINDGSTPGQGNIPLTFHA
jgi:hypothetical protein